MQPSIAVPPALLRQRLQPIPQDAVIRPYGPIAHARPIGAQHPTRPPLAHLVDRLQVRRRFSMPLWPVSLRPTCENSNFMEHRSTGSGKKSDSFFRSGDTARGLFAEQGVPIACNKVIAEITERERNQPKKCANQLPAQTQLPEHANNG